MVWVELSDQFSKKGTGTFSRFAQDASNGFCQGKTGFASTPTNSPFGASTYQSRFGWLCRRHRQSGRRWFSFDLPGQNGGSGGFRDVGDYFFGEIIGEPVGGYVPDSHHDTMAVIFCWPGNQQATRYLRCAPPQILTQNRRTVSTYLRLRLAVGQN